MLIFRSFRVKPIRKYQLEPGNKNCVTRYNRSDFKALSLFINEKSVEQVRSFVYLGTCITDGGRNEGELNRRAGRAKTHFMNLKNVPSNSKLNLETRLKMQEYYVW